MQYLMAVIFPPVAFLMKGKPFQAFLSLILVGTLLGWIPATIWACCVVGAAEADERNFTLVEAINPRMATAHRKRKWDAAQRNFKVALIVLLGVIFLAVIPRLLWEMHVQLPDFITNPTPSTMPALLIGALGVIASPVVIFGAMSAVCFLRDRKH
jgi:uncharacterized membrane protein YqaE (UPF0057 family)